MKNLFIKIMLMINALASVYPCVWYFVNGLRNIGVSDVHYLIYFGVFHAVQIILSISMFIYIFISEDKHKESDVSDETDDNNK